MNFKRKKKKKESVSRKNQQGCRQVGHEKEKNHAEVSFRESNSGYVMVGSSGDSVGNTSELLGIKQGSLRIYPHTDPLRTDPGRR